MSQVQRTNGEYGLEPPQQSAARYQYDAGGHIAALQSKLARQLERDAADTMLAMGPVEKLTQLCSRVCGYTMLGVGYALTSVIILRYL